MPEQPPIPDQETVGLVRAVRRGKIARWQMFHSEQQALEAAGFER